MDGGTHLGTEEKARGFEQNGRLSREEFNSIFDLLGIQATEQKREILFCYCDKGCQGYITREEFADAWDYLVLQMSQSILRDEFGLSETQTNMFLAWLALGLILVFVFLLTSMSAYSQNKDFNAIVQSTIIGLAAKASEQISNTVGSGRKVVSLSSPNTSIDKLVESSVETRTETQEK